MRKTKGRSGFGSTIEMRHRRGWLQWLWAMTVWGVVATGVGQAQVQMDTLLHAGTAQVLSPHSWIMYEGNSVHRTVDAGRNWEEVSPIPPDSAREIAFADWRPDSTALIIYVHSSSLRDTTAYIVAYSPDDGVNWEYSEFVVAEQFPVPPRTRSDHFVRGPGSAFLLQVYEQVYRSTDLGQSFEKRNPAVNAKLLYSGGDVTFTWAIRDSISVTTDGGGSWIDVRVPAAFENMQADWRGNIIGYTQDTLFVSFDHGTSWKHIPAPVNGETVLSESYLTAGVVDASDIWLFMTRVRYASKQWLYRSRDGGANWTVMPAPEKVGLLRLDAERALVGSAQLGAGVRFLMTIPQQQPLILLAENRGSLTRGELLLTWNDPGVAGQIAGYNLERAGEDSSWTTLPVDILPPDQFCYVDQPEDGGREFRYRLTMRALSGESYVAYSDPVRMLPDAYIDLLDAILPAADDHQQLRYEQFTRSRIGYTGDDKDTTIILTYTFQPPEHHSRWITRYPIRVEGDGPSGEHWSTWTWLDEYRTQERYLLYVDTARNTVGYSPLSLRAWPRLIPADRSGDYRDSLEFEAVFIRPLGGEGKYTFTCKPADGIIHSIVGGIPPYSGGAQSTRLTLLRTVNGIPADYSAVAIDIGVPYPNPVFSTAALPFSLASAGHVLVTIHDMLGREVARLVDGPRDAGRQQTILDAHGLRPGVYLLRLQSGSAVSTRMFIRP